MNGLALVMLGGAVGAGSRYAVGGLFARDGFPWGTLTVNLVGALAMGLVAGFVMRGSGDASMRLLLGVGVLGGFTTFSAFGLDTIMLLERGAFVPALGYVATSVVGAVALTALGLTVARA